MWIELNKFLWIIQRWGIYFVAVNSWRTCNSGKTEGDCLREIRKNISHIN